MTRTDDSFAEYPKQVRSRTQSPYVVYELVTGREDGRAVYASKEGGAEAIPSGRIFIRFAEGTIVSDREADLEKAGYEIEETISYAENAAWIRERSGSVAKALKGIEKLERIEGVENVEPQMLTKRVAR